MTFWRKVRRIWDRIANGIATMSASVITSKAVARLNAIGVNLTTAGSLSHRVKFFLTQQSYGFSSHPPIYAAIVSMETAVQYLFTAGMAKTPIRRKKMRKDILMAHRAL